MFSVEKGLVSPQGGRGKGSTVCKLWRLSLKLTREPRFDLPLKIFSSLFMSLFLKVAGRPQCERPNKMVHSVGLTSTVLDTKVRSVVGRVSRVRSGDYRGRSSRTWCLRYFTSQSDLPFLSKKVTTTNLVQSHRRSSSSTSRLWIEGYVFL